MPYSYSAPPGYQDLPALNKGYYSVHDTTVSMTHVLAVPVTTVSLTDPLNRNIPAVYNALTTAGHMQ